ncbi:hypothetical protein [Flavobacterium sp. N1994]|uniref:hypothetical protein n=1 Tax=Flavobacterium sp. N1994 TaxID=2986827 RepID=UPI0022225B16|nr:hypothetical protein [Flavobacterium sp. N1994]
MEAIEKKEFQLIDGIFSPDEANAVLTNLITSKINYHNLDDFSHFVRSDRNIEHSKKRISELIATKNDMKSFIAMAKEKGCHLVIKSSIAIEITK